jgi:hypothetical protein
MSFFVLRVIFVVFTPPSSKIEQNSYQLLRSAILSRALKYYQ